MWIDSHCHLDHERLLSLGTASVVHDLAKRAGVAGILSVNCQIVEELTPLVELVTPLRNVWCTIGTHPHEASRPDEKALRVADLVRLSRSSEKIIGIGETGLDYFYTHSTHEDQVFSFRKHIQACLESELPMIVHARDADADIIRIIREETDGQGMKGVMHCFSSGQALANEAVELGFYISFSGILTFKKSEDLRDIARTIPLDRLLVETDSPYLAPEPHRGGINQPAYVGHTGEVLARLHEKSSEEMARITTENFFTLFRRAQLQ